MKKHIVCSIGELAKILAHGVTLTPCKTNFSPSNFSVITEYHGDEKDPEVIASGAEGWYGIHSIDTKFGDDGLTLCANYYGGGNPAFAYLTEGDGVETIINQISVAIIRALRLEGMRISLDTMLVAEVSPCLLREMEAKR